MYDNFISDFLVIVIEWIFQFVGEYSITIILAIIPVTSWILGAITRFMRGHWIAGILQLVTGVGTLIFWVLDIITAVTSGDLKFFA